MNPAPASEFTRLLEAGRAGDAGALNRLMPIVYDELRRLAHYHLSAERQDHTLQTTALVNEAYLRLAGNSPDYQNRTHFFALAAKTMRRILVDYAKARLRSKRGGGAQRVDLEEALAIQVESDGQILDLDEALTALEVQDERKARIIELIFFSGLTREEVADVLQISQPTVFRELRLAKAWLHSELSKKSALR